MNITPKEIYAFKLITGEEIIAKVLAVHDDVYTIEHPITTAITPSGLQLIPGMLTANLEQGVELNKSALAMTAEAREDIKNSWIQAVTGITPITKKIITG